MSIKNNYDEIKKGENLLACQISCFKSYDVRGEIDVNFDSEIVYRIGRALATHLEAKEIVVGYDVRPTSINFSKIIANGIRVSGVNDLSIGDTLKLLKPNYTYRKDKNIYSTVDNLGDEWSGLVDIKIVNIEFAD